MQRSDEIIYAALETVETWYESKRAKRTGSVHFNVMAVGLAVAGFLKKEFPISTQTVSAENGAQVRGLNASFIKKCLATRGVLGKVPVEGGRTSRGSLTNALSLALAINDTLTPFAPSYTERAFVADAIEDFFVGCIKEDYFNRQRIDVSIDIGKPVSSIVSDIIAAAQQRDDKPSGTVVQHLVGAKLELRFPELGIGRDRANAADQQTNRQGDFQLGTTAFHVTMSPMARLQDRVRENIREGYRPVILVPRDKVDFAHGLFQSEPDLVDRVGVQSIETFIGTNIEELGSFDANAVKRAVALLIRVYNQRIEEVETDMSLRIIEPQWIAGIVDV